MRKMFTILLADKNIKNLKNLENYLLNDFSVSVISETTVEATISTYDALNPDILLITSNFANKGCDKILRTISNNSEEINNSNVIISVDDKNEILDLKKYPKIYKIFYTPMTYPRLSNLIKEYAISHNLVIRDVSWACLYKLFEKLNFRMSASGTKYLMYAVQECFKDYSLLEKDLNYIYDHIAKNFNTTSSIRSSIRSSLRQFNREIDKIDVKELFLRFKDRGNISPRYFLDVVTSYLYNEMFKG